MEKITSRRNTLAAHIKKLGADRSYRLQSKEFYCDGVKLLEEAVKSGAEVVAVLTSAHIAFPLPLETRVYQTTRDIIDSLSPLKNAQDTVFTCKLPQHSSIEHTAKTGILLDGIQDPGNLGTIIRTADAFSIDSVILTGNCADLYNPKTIRATMGTVFRQKTYNMDISELLALKKSGFKFIGASSGIGCKTIQNTALNDAIIAIGSEAHGLSQEVLALCGETFTIPTAPHSESLNAAIAAAIIIWESKK